MPLSFHYDHEIELKNFDLSDLCFRHFKALSSVILLIKILC